ncbi:MAG TPA: hypothetical protein VMG31_08615 [Verrucomicrobiae bacterium]|nr:hypothetical protein [Verrucomicrobiae bacterium]
MQKLLAAVTGLVLVGLPSFAQGKRLWVLRAPGEMVEYDPATFAVKQTVKVPADALQSPQNLQVNRLGQILFVPSATLPLADSDAHASHKIWLWDGHAASTIDLGVTRQLAETGSNQAISEIAPMVYLSADGGHLYWFANQARRLARDEVDLSTATSWLAWRTDLTGASREDLVSAKFPDCRCTTGTCEETCPYAQIWVPSDGVDKFFLMTQFVAGQTSPAYQASARYEEKDGKWTARQLTDPLRRVLDAEHEGNVIVEAIPDTGCCGWANRSDDQTLVLIDAKPRAVFDEIATYKNPDYDVSFYTSNAFLSPSSRSVAMTITATSQPNKPIQLADQGQANPEESQAIRKALTELPAVEAKELEDPPRRLAFLPHATSIGWIGDQEILILENHSLTVYNVATGTRRKTTVRADDAARVFLR